MITYSIKPILIPLGECSTDWLAVCIPAALSVEDWEIGETDDMTLLPQAIKNERYHAEFYWSDAEGAEVAKNDATHLAVQVGSPNATEKECAFEQHALANRVKVARDGTMVDLAL